eukprot:825355-Pleurochrysis_carterae.AAC.1
MRSLHKSVLTIHVCLDSGMYLVNTHTHSNFITLSPAHAVTHARTCYAARRPEPAAARVHPPDRAVTRPHALVSTNVLNAMHHHASASPRSAVGS